MDITKILKNYCLKFALPLVVVTLIVESAFIPTSYLGSILAYKVKAGTAERYLMERGGLREGQIRGRDFFDKLNLPIYEGEAGKTLPLKDFMVGHITGYEPGIFLGLADDWAALEKWNLDTDGQKYLVSEFGEELVQVLNYTASTYSYYWKSTTVEYKEMGEVLDFMMNQRDYSKVYKTRSNRQTGSGTRQLVLVN